MGNRDKRGGKRRAGEKESKQSTDSSSWSDPLVQMRGLSDQALDEAEAALIARRKLTRRFLREIEKEIEEALRMLQLLGDPWKHGDKTEYEFMRISLDKALTSRKKERRARLLEEWKDLLSLHERRIELLRENLALGLGHGRGDGVPAKNGDES